MYLLNYKMNFLPNFTEMILFLGQRWMPLDHWSSYLNNNTKTSFVCLYCLFFLSVSVIAPMHNFSCKSYCTQHKFERHLVNYLGFYGYLVQCKLNRISTEPRNTSVQRWNALKQAVDIRVLTLLHSTWEFKQKVWVHVTSFL